MFLPSLNLAGLSSSLLEKKGSPTVKPLLSTRSTSTAHIMSSLNFGLSVLVFSVVVSVALSVVTSVVVLVTVLVVVSVVASVVGSSATPY